MICQLQFRISVSLCMPMILKLEDHSLQLQKSSNTKVYEWLKCNKFNLNTMKTEFMIFGTNNRLKQLDESPVTTPYTLCFYNFKIKTVKHTKYLGLIVNDTLTWGHHMEYISTKINRNIGILKRTQNYLPRSSLITLHKTLIEPYFRYCNIVWGQCNETLKDKLQS